MNSSYRAGDTACIDRLAELRCASGSHCPIRLMERKAAIVPGKFAMGEDAPRLRFEIRDYGYAPPMLHKTRSECLSGQRTARSHRLRKMEPWPWF